MRPPSRHKTPPKAVGLENLPPGPRTPPDDEPSFRDNPWDNLERLDDESDSGENLGIISDNSLGDSGMLSPTNLSRFGGTHEVSGIAYDMGLKSSGKKGSDSRKRINSVTENT